MANPGGGAECDRGGKCMFKFAKCTILAGRFAFELLLASCFWARGDASVATTQIPWFKVL